ncbi:dihydrouridine synthase family protein [Pseudobdellovibrio exovorus JSS]|uniref:tRNA-dihydrouridine synthase n=2 Tax=Pseudobdellovibrio exovorus TaxID=453816 RepID=M4VRN3_9BACT|nr:dihydrouridine synthase family protein [Pseudobdellovibrio exovorus JSS]
MEGVTDWAMRDLLTQLGGIDQCVTEFLRVTDHLHSDEVFYKNCPELLTGSRTRSGTPVFIQLLGGKVDPLVANAVRAVELGALGVDLNFGCPAKTVNRHDGGAALLQYTDRIYNIVSAVRKAVPLTTPVTAKIRLGFDNPNACLENAKAVEAAGADWLTVHCRTKTDGYKPPAYWEWIAKIKEVSNIRLVTNGEIWSVQDFKKCHAQAQTEDYMIGRAALRDPFLFKKIKDSLNETPSTYDDIKVLLPRFFESSSNYVSAPFAVARTKGWLKQLAHTAPEFNILFDELKVITKPIEFEQRISSL